MWLNSLDVVLSRKYKALLVSDEKMTFPGWMPACLHWMLIHFSTIARFSFTLIPFRRIEPHPATITSNGSALTQFYHRNPNCSRSGSAWMNLPASLDRSPTHNIAAHSINTERHIRFEGEPSGVSTGEPTVSVWGRHLLRRSGVGHAIGLHPLTTGL